MEHSIKYTYFMSQLTHIKDIKESDKVKISVVYHERLDAPCILRICKNRDLSSVYSTLRQIRNPNTVVVHDFVYDNGDTYILEELVDGRTISEILTQTGILSEETTAKIIIKVCNALETLHCQKPPVVHNDINPSNIKIREDGSVKLFDFDISRTYKKGQQQNTVLFGTEEYAAPEHFGYGQSEPRTDIYCLGVTMHKMLTGKSLSNEHRITYNGKLKSIVKKCLAIDPQHRYSSVTELKKDLDRYLQRKNRLLKSIIKCACFSAIILVSFLLLGKFGTKVIGFQANRNGATILGLNGTGLSDTTSKDILSMETDFSQLIGIWVEEDASWQSGGLWLEMYSHESKMYVNVAYAGEAPDSRIAEFSLEIRPEDIIKNSIQLEFDDDSWGNAGKFNITYTGSTLVCTVSDTYYTGNNAFSIWQIPEGSFILIRNDLAQGLLAYDAEYATTDNSSEYDDSNTSTVIETKENIPQAQQNHTRETASLIAVNQKNAAIVEAENSNWYRFTTSNDLSAYRINLYAVNPPTHMSFPYIYIALFDSLGIKLEEFEVWSDDEHSFLDVYLEPNTEYFFKVYLGGRFTTGNYEVSVSQMACDAGADKDTATPLALGSMHAAILDSTLSDWYVFQVPDNKEYTYTIHNIDVGCDIYFSKQQPHNAGEGMSIANEDNFSGSIDNLQQGDLVYFEIYAHNKSPNANGTYIIVIEESQ